MYNMMQSYDQVEEKRRLSSLDPLAKDEVKRKDNTERKKYDSGLNLKQSRFSLRPYVPLIDRRASALNMGGTTSDSHTQDDDDYQP